MVAAITVTITTIMIDDNPFTNIQKAYAQLQPQPIVGGPGDQTLAGDPNLPFPGNQMYGDTAGSLTSGQQGGNDELTGGDYSINQLIGDAREMSSSTGGNDQLTGGDYAEYNFLAGDAGDMYSSTGGNDQLTGGDYNEYNEMYGDANTMIDSQGGDDILTGGTGTNYMYGDAAVMDNSRGGDDILFAGTGTNYMFGDAIPEYTSTTSTGGNDRLITTTGGKGSTYELTGGGGKDLFVTGGNTDPNIITITDYIEGEDTIAGALAKDYRTGTTTTTGTNEQQQIEGQLNALLVQDKVQKSPTTTPISTTTTNANEQQQTTDVLNAILLKGKSK